MKHASLVAQIVALNGGKLIGKTRLQKTVYLLEECGMDGGFFFDYHNFGPFSVELASATDVAQFSKKIKIREKRGYHDVPYSIFETGEPSPKKLGALTAKSAKSLLKLMDAVTANDLEIAATLHFVNSEYDGEVDADDEVRELKPVKATDERLDRAHSLLEDLGLE